MNRRLGTLLLVGVFCWLGHIPISAAKDRLVVGYTAMTGVKAGMWVAVEANLFDKYNIQPHREDSLQCARRRSGGLEPGGNHKSQGQASAAGELLRRSFCQRVGRGRLL